jgi:large subunit ribosomal protein L27
MAHKKATGSVKNVRDSQPKFRGVKVFGGQLINAWGIVIRQAGSKYHLWSNVYEGKDFTIHAAIDGVVTFSKKKVLKFDGRKFIKTHVSVEPVMAS